MCDEIIAPFSCEIDDLNPQAWLILRQFQNMDATDDVGPRIGLADEYCAFGQFIRARLKAPGGYDHADVRPIRKYPMG